LEVYNSSGIGFSWRGYNLLCVFRNKGCICLAAHWKGGNEVDIACFLVAEGEFKKAIIPEELATELIKSLRTKGTEIVHFQNSSVEVEGIYIPAKGSKTKMMLIPDEE
jgi:hypothetical protein